MAEMKLSYRGSVNRWECDENDHMNVRFFVERHWQTLLGLNDEQNEGVRQDRIRVQHIRFQKEARLATPISGYWSIVRSGEQAVVLTELRHSVSGDLLSSCVHDICLDKTDALSDVGGLDLQDLSVEAGPRGVPAHRSEFADVGIDQAKQLGFQLIGTGTLEPRECDPAGQLMSQHLMGRLSDSMPHLWHHLYSGGEREVHSAEEGGAVLEYRFEFLEPLAAGDVYQIYSGLAVAGEKVQRFSHLVFSDNKLCVTAEAVGVRMDLTRRGVITLTPQQVELLSSKALTTP